MSICPRTVRTVAQARTLQLLCDKYVLVQFQPTHFAIFDWGSNACIFTLRTDHGVSAFEAVLRPIGAEGVDAVIELYLGYSDGNCELIQIVVTVGGAPNLFFNTSVSTNIAERSILHKFDKAVALITSSRVCSLVILMDKSGKVVFRSLDSEAVIAENDVSSSACPLTCSFYKFGDSSTSSIDSCGSESRGSKSVVLVGRKDGTVECRIVGFIDSAATSRLLYKLNEPVVGVYRMSARPVASHPELEDNACIYIVIGRSGFVHVLTSAGRCFCIGNVLNNDYYKCTDYENAKEVRYACVWRDRFVVVHYGHSIYAADLKPVQDHGMSQVLPPLRFTAISGITNIMCTTWMEDFFAASLSSGALLVVPLPTPSVKDADDVEYFERDLLRSIEDYFAVLVNPSSVTENKKSASSNQLSNARRIERERERMDETIKVEKVMRAYGAKLDAEIRKLVALNRIAQREANSPGLEDCLLSLGKVVVKLEPQRCAESGSAIVVATITSSDPDYVKAIHGRVVMVSVAKLGLEAESTGTQTLSCTIKFRRNQNLGDYYAEMAFPVVFDEICRHVVDVHIEMSMMLPDEQTDVGMASMAAFVQSGNKDDNRDLNKNGFLLPLGTVFVEPSEVMDVVGVVESIFRSSCGRIDSHLLQGSLPVTFPLVSKSPTLIASIERIKKCCAKLHDEASVDPLASLDEDNTNEAVAEDLLRLEVDKQTSRTTSGVSRMTIKKADSLAMKVSLSMELLQAALNDMPHVDGFKHEAPSLEEIESAQLGPSAFALPSELLEVKRLLCSCVLNG